MLTTHSVEDGELCDEIELDWNGWDDAHICLDAEETAALRRALFEVYGPLEDGEGE
jgi:hypothetical protein